jgi:rSAM/selenodomain-associated transferase 1
MPHTDSARSVIVFAKAPRPGHAKTRLIPLLGAEGAAALHARLIKHTLSTVRQAGFRAIYLYGAPAEDDFLRFCAERYGAELIPQSGGDLGARMCAALADTLATSTSAVLIGSDCPAMTPHALRGAVRALEDGKDAAFVPTEDGGYALIALKRCHPTLFDGIAWSTSAVMEDTRARLRVVGWTWEELDLLWDVDTPEDYERLLASRLI